MSPIFTSDHNAQIYTARANAYVYTIRIYIIRSVVRALYIYIYIYYQTRKAFGGRAFN